MQLEASPLLFAHGTQVLAGEAPNHKIHLLKDGRLLQCPHVTHMLDLGMAHFHHLYCRFALQVTTHTNKHILQLLKVMLRVFCCQSETLHLMPSVITSLGTTQNQKSQHIHSLPPAQNNPRTIYSSIKKTIETINPSFLYQHLNINGQ